MKTNNLFRRIIWPLVKLVLVVAIIGGIVYWVKFSPVPVEAHKIENGEIVAQVMGTGTLEARVNISISPKISGRIDSISADQGDKVLAGKLLVQLDDAEFVQQVEIAEASLAASKAAVTLLSTDIVRAEAVLTQAKQQHERTKKLIARKAVSESDLDRAVEALAIAQAGLARSEAAIIEGQAQVLAAEKNLAYQQTVLSDTKILAPFDGLVVIRKREPGDVVVPGSPIMTFVSLEQLWISAWVDETEMDRLQPGQTARVIFRSEPDKAYPGKVIRLGKEADRETREYIVDVQVLELPKNWAIGQRTEVFIETERKQSVVRLPAQFVVRKENSPGVFVTENSKASWRAIELGSRSPDFVEVVKGLEAGETVVKPKKLGATLVAGRKVTTE